jgi:gamma-glutamyl-gamma-aminobutyrate hydrolase PuuD
MSKKMSEKGSRRRPLVGITMRHELETERFYLARFYSEAVEAAGGVPLHISLIPDESYLEEVVGRLDALLLPGSASDVDPALVRSGAARASGLRAPFEGRDGHARPQVRGGEASAAPGDLLRDAGLERLPRRER